MTWAVGWWFLIIASLPTPGLATEPAPIVLCPQHMGSLGDSGKDPRVQESTVLVVQKQRRTVGVYQEGQLVVDAHGRFACWPIALAAGYPPGDKEREGDLKTPEGWYRVSDKPQSSFYSAMLIHYPNVSDAHRGVRLGILHHAEREQIAAAQKATRAPPQQTPMGGQILFHGGGSSADWTLGCIALNDRDLDGLRDLLPHLMNTWTLILP